MDESNKSTRMDQSHAINHQTNFSMITNFGKELKEFQHGVSNLDSRLTEWIKHVLTCGPSTGKVGRI